MSNFSSTLYEGNLLWRKEKKWEKVHARLGLLNKQHVLRLSSSKSENVILESIAITKELAVVGPMPEKDRYAFHLSNGRDVMHLAEKHPVVNEWIERITRIIDSLQSETGENEIQPTTTEIGLISYKQSIENSANSKKRSPRSANGNSSPKSGKNPVSSLKSSGTRSKRALSNNVPKILMSSKNTGSYKPKSARRCSGSDKDSSDIVSSPKPKTQRDSAQLRASLLPKSLKSDIPENGNYFPKYKNPGWPDLEAVSDFSESEEEALVEPKSEDLPSEEKEAGKNMEKNSEEYKEAEKKREDRRKLIAMEIYTTEKNYVDSLAFLINHYMKPLLNSTESTGETQATILQIFGNVEVLYGFNQKLLEEIAKITSTWTHESVIGPMFKTMVPFLKMYTAYSSNYTVATATLAKHLATNDKFKKEVTLIFDGSGSGLDLMAYLIMPIQRIPRYSLLLRDLLNHTAVDHPDYQDLLSSSTQIVNVANHINEEVRRSENTQRFEAMVAKGIDLTGFIEPHRSFIKYGVIKVVVENYSGDLKKEASQFFILFTDIFIHIKKSGISGTLHDTDLKRPQYLWPVELTWLDDSDPTETVLLGPTEKLVFNDKEWTQVLKKAISARLDFVNSTNAQGKDGKKQTELLRFGTYTYPEGGKYKGQWRLAKRHGKGTWIDMNTKYSGEWKDNDIEGKGYFHYVTGEVYYGGWLGGRPNGKGQLAYSDGTRFTGEWVRGVRTGLGKIDYENGDIFKGIFKDDRLVEGELYTSSGLTYKGSFSDGLFNGVGILSLPDGSCYEGEIKDGAKHGRGVMKYRVSSDSNKTAIYFGLWENDTRHGTGTLIDEISSTNYYGQWVNDKPHGHGKKEYPGGTVYEGDWVEGLRSGKGKCSFRDNSYYEGDWLQDKHHGEGESKDSTGTTYKGSWLLGSKQGRGEYTLPNGATYKGNIVNALPHKSGIYHGGDGDFIESYEGEWLNGLMHGKGSLVLQNGHKYQGIFANNTFHGEGVYTTSSGAIFDGKWEYGVISGKATITNPDSSPQNAIIIWNSINSGSGHMMNLPPVFSVLPVLFPSSSRK